jgi:prephenate dehydrogenase
MAFPKKIAIIGLGLIGGSLGQAFLKKFPKTEVIGIPRRKVTIELAKKKKAVSRATLDLAAVKDADLVIIATPIDTIITTFKNLIPYLRRGTIVTDVASTKGALVAELEAMCPPGVYYVGGHPMAGLEKTGIEFADANILKGATFVLTQTKSTARSALKTLTGLIKKLGMVPLQLTPATHDLVVAAISHLPYIVASALAGTAKGLGQYEKLLEQLAAGGFRDTTRVASASPGWGRDVIATNREQIIEVLDIFQKQLNVLRSLIDDRDTVALEKIFAGIKEYRDAFYRVKGKARR